MKHNKLFEKMNTKQIAVYVIQNIFCFLYFIYLIVYILFHYKSIKIFVIYGDGVESLPFAESFSEFINKIETYGKTNDLVLVKYEQKINDCYILLTGSGMGEDELIALIESEL